MGTVTVDEIIADAGIQLFDAGHTRWTSDELVGYVNMAQRAIVTKKPDANTVTEAVQLAAGTKQTPPAGTYRVIDVHRNMGTDGLTEGTTVTVADKKVQDRMNPGWHQGTPAAVVENWYFDPRMPDVFWVSPPQPSTGQGYIELTRSVIPDPIALGDAITLDDAYANAILHYTLFMAFSKDAKHRAMQVRASNQFELFRVAIGEKEQAELKAETVVTDEKIHEGVKG